MWLIHVAHTQCLSSASTSALAPKERCRCCQHGGLGTSTAGCAERTAACCVHGSVHAQSSAACTYVDLLQLDSCVACHACALPCSTALFPCYITGHSAACLSHTEAATSILCQRPTCFTPALSLGRACAVPPFSAWARLCRANMRAPRPHDRSADQTRKTYSVLYSLCSSRFLVLLATRLRVAVGSS